MIKTLAKIIVLSGMVMLLSACAGPSRYNGYSGNDAYSSGYNYPGGGGGYYPQPAYPYGNYRNNPYPRYPAYPANPGYGRPYYGGYPNNYNRNQPRPIQAPPGFYRNQKPPVAEQHNHRHVENNYYYGRPPYNQGGKPGGFRAQPNPPAAGRYNNWQGQQPQRNYGNQPNWGNNRGNWQRPQGNNFNRQAGGGQWQGQNRPQQQPVVRIQNNGGNVNFGRMNDRMGQQPAQPGQNRANWERRKKKRNND
ncbi:hypothetical protein MCAMS1_01083 [biofilm metagenome]